VEGDQTFVPARFDVATQLETPSFMLEPLGPEHNVRDFKAWTSSIDHIRAAPGFEGRSWPHPMTLEENLGDLEMQARHFRDREGFTYTVLDPDRDVIGCVYIYPALPSLRCRGRVSRARSRRERSAPLAGGGKEREAICSPLASLSVRPL
jgi:hypothetical protein